jgi:hypothetical protein
MTNIKLSQFNTGITKTIIPFFLSTFLLASCTPGGTVTRPSGIPPELQEQIDRTTGSNTTSGENAILQARIIYGQLVGRWNTVSPIDVQAFADTRDKLLPPMFIVANSLTSDATISTDKQSLKDDFKEIYYNSLTNMLKGINNNLQIYQGFLENSQVINATDPNFDDPFDDTGEGIATLANIFVATEITELYVAQLGQFTTISPNDETIKLLNGLKNQQTTIINGIINYTTQNKITLAQAKTAYQIIVKSLTSPTLLSSLANLAITIYGRDNVAFKQDELTAAQSNPNLIVMVIKEDSSTYRMISIDNNRVVNRISNDNRGLSASDILNQTNVVKVQ